jgi:hypothetical protein
MFVQPGFSTDLERTAPGHWCRSVARNSIGIVLVGGMTIGTFFTLFVVPTVYVVIAKDHRANREEKPRPAAVERLVDSDEAPSILDLPTAAERAWLYVAQGTPIPKCSSM